MEVMDLLLFDLRAIMLLIPSHVFFILVKLESKNLYFVYKAAYRPALLRYWTSLFNWLLRHRVFLASWKIGLQVFLPKPNKSDYSLPKSWRPITLYPTVFKIACRVISMTASRQLVNADQISPTQKGGITGVSGTSDATFLLRSCIDHHRRHKTSMYVLVHGCGQCIRQLGTGSDQEGHFDD